MAKNTKKASAETATKKPRATLQATPKRVLKRPEYKSFKLAKRITHPVRLPSVWRLLNMSLRTLWAHKVLFVGIATVYGLLSLVLVKGLSDNTDIMTLKDNLDQIFAGSYGSLASGVGVFTVLVGSAGSGSSDTAGAYQFFLTIIASLALIWALRQVFTGNHIRIRDSYYQGMAPLVPFILVLFVIAVQLLPLLLGATLYSIVAQNGIAVYAAEKFIWALLYGLLALLSLYMITSSVFALYVVTLPDMTPLKALRSARALVRYRRWTVLRKIIALPIVLLIIAAIIMLPIIVWATPLAQWVFFILTMLSLVAVHGYMYTLYRELLRE
jgi:hypothetical protein